MKFLKDIRLGNVKLLVQKECEFAIQIENTNQQLMSHITEKSKLQKQIAELRD